MCERYPSMKWYNVQKSKLYDFKCHTFRCPECNPPKVRWLYHVIKEILEKWSHIRMWTFTSTNRFLTPEQHYTVMNETLRRLTTYLRRSALLTASQQKFQYIRINELHKSGYVHFHIVIDTYLDYYLVQNLFLRNFRTAIHHYAEKFNLSTEAVEYYDNHLFAHCNVSHSLNAAQTTKYILKYLTKAINTNVSILKRVYSKSNGMRFYPDRIPSKDLNFLIKFQNTQNGFLNLSIKSITSHFGDFSGEIFAFIRNDILKNLVSTPFTEFNDSLHHET